MNVKTNIKAGGLRIQHNETLASGLKVKTSVKAGGLRIQHNETFVNGQ